MGELQGERGRKALAKKEIALFQLPRPSPSLTPPHTRGDQASLVVPVEVPRTELKSARDYPFLLLVTGEMLIPAEEFCTDDLLGGEVWFPLSSRRSQPVATG